MSFADMIKDARLDARISQRALAEQLKTTQKPEGVWATYVGQIEKGEKVPSDEVCVKLAEVLKLDTTRVLLAAYEARAADSPAPARALFSLMERALTDALVSQLLEAEAPFDPSVLTALGRPGIAAGLSDPQWVDAFERSYAVGKKRNVPGLIKLVEAMNDKQWTGLMAMLESMGLEPDEG
jgi:transcriptional regulator with XRE-family HTH domain